MQSVKCWGVNDYGQLGLGDKTSRGSRAGQMGDFLPAVDLGAGRYAVRVSCGEFHSCAVLDDGSVKCWGSGAAGQLGLGDTSAPGGTRGTMGDALLQVATSSSLSCSTNILVCVYIRTYCI